MSSMAPARTGAFREALARELPSVEIRVASEAYEVDGLLPSIAIAPSTEDEVARTLRLAQVHSLSVMAHGGGRHVEFGNAPASYDVAIDTTRLNHAIDHEPDDMTVTVDGGVSLGGLQRVLGERGQWLPIDPPCYPDATIGGLLAVNAYGPARHAYGTLRDWVIGMRVAHPDGTVTKSGGRVVKNVSGYDMHKLHIGALGTLGIITQATFKLAPLPHTSVTATFAAASADAVCALVLHARHAGLAIEAAEVLSPAAARPIAQVDGWCALLRVAGSSAAVERTLRDFRAIGAELGGAIDATVDPSIWTRQSSRDTPPFARPSWNDKFMWALLAMRVSVAPSRVAEALPELGGAVDLAEGLLSATVCAGVIRINVNADISDDARMQVIDTARRVAERSGGVLLVDSAPPAIKAQLDVFGPARSDFEIMRRLKEQFDPHRTLAPGRFIGRL